MIEIGAEEALRLVAPTRLRAEKIRVGGSNAKAGCGAGAVDGGVGGAGRS
jgi:hypothetical protein